MIGARLSGEVPNRRRSAIVRIAGKTFDHASAQEPINGPWRITFEFFDGDAYRVATRSRRIGHPDADVGVTGVGGARFNGASPLAEALLRVG